MKKLLTTVGLVVLMGCSTFQSNSGKFLASTAESVNLAMQGWAMYVVQNNVPTNQQASVKLIYQQYQLAMINASNVWNATLNSTDRTLWTAASNQVARTQQALTSTVTFMQTTTPPPTPQ